MLVTGQMTIISQFGQFQLAIWKHVDHVLITWMWSKGGSLSYDGQCHTKKSQCKSHYVHARWLKCKIRGGEPYI